jgi:hypothetical protein
MTEREIHPLPQIFTGRRERTVHHHRCGDPKDGELCLNRVKPEETLARLQNVKSEKATAFLTGQWSS